MRVECRPLPPSTQTGVHVLYCTSVAHMSNRSAVFAQANQVVIHASTVYLFLLPSVLSSFRVTFFSVNHTALTLCLAFVSSGFWRACCVRPATPSSSNALLCTALSTRAQTASQVLERMSFQMWQVRPRVPYDSLLLTSSSQIKNYF